MTSKVKYNNVSGKNSIKLPAKNMTPLKNGCSEALFEKVEKSMSAKEAYQWVSTKYKETLQRLAND
jgi:hypothetical protein